MPCKEVLIVDVKPKHNIDAREYFDTVITSLWLYPVTAEPIVQLCMNIVWKDDKSNFSHY